MLIFGVMKYLSYNIQYLVFNFFSNLRLIIFDVLLLMDSIKIKFSYFNSYFGKR